MFPINGRFGHRFVFQEFIGDSDLIIPGEVQHSFWSHEKWFENTNMLNFNFPKFVWGGTFYEIARKGGIKGFTPIGDPFLYHLKSCSCEYEIKGESSSWGLYPQFKRTDTTLDRIKNHIFFIDEVLTLVPEPLIVFFHPWELITTEIANLYLSKGIQIQQQVVAGHKNFLKIKHKEYLSLRGLITNYVGPHVFRATMVGVDCKITSSANLLNDNSLLSKEHIEIFDIESNGNFSDSDRLAMSAFQLGKSYMREPEEIGVLFKNDGKSQARLRKIKTVRNFISKSRNIFLKTEKIDISVNKFTNLICEHCFSDIIIFQAGKKARCGTCFRKYILSPSLEK